MQEMFFAPVAIKPRGDLLLASLDQHVTMFGEEQSGIEHLLRLHPAHRLARRPRTWRAAFALALTPELPLTPALSRKRERERPNPALPSPQRGREQDHQGSACVSSGCTSRINQFHPWSTSPCSCAISCSDKCRYRFCSKR
jgi:hypothetical protein